MAGLDEDDTLYWLTPWPGRGIMVSRRLLLAVGSSGFLL